MVYAFPADRPNRFAAIAPILHVTAGRVAAYFANHYDAFRTPIWDIRTNCSASFSLDILALQLPRPSAAYSGSGLFGTNSSLLMADAKALLQSRIPYAYRNPVVFVDGVQGTPPGTFRGFGELLDQWTQNPAFNLNSYNRGNMSIVVGPPSYVPQPGDTMPDRGVQPALFAHEMMHALGAVLSGTPNATGAGFWHCNDERDVMCYDEGGAGWNPTPPEKCPVLAGRAGAPAEYLFAERLDCGQDDYFSPAPRGAWLSQYWNTYASYYLGGCSYYYCGVRMPSGSEDD